MRLTRRTVLVGVALSGCATAAPVRRTLIFPAPDGVPVSGHIYGEGRHGLILVPGAHGIGETWDQQASRLAEIGFRVLAMDYRGLGRSPPVPQDSDKAHLDVIGAVRRLQADGSERISIVGASWGGRAAAAAAIAMPGVVDRMILLAPSAFDSPERLEGRKLFIVAAEDRDGSGQLRLDSIRALYERVPEPKSLVVLDGAAHAQFLFLTPQAERLHAEMLRFMSAA